MATTSNADGDDAASLSFRRCWDWVTARPADYSALDDSQSHQSSSASKLKAAPVRTASAFKLKAEASLQAKGLEIAIAASEELVLNADPSAHIIAVLHYEHQHTVRWSGTLRHSTSADTLPAGACNLYTYPSVHAEGLPKAVEVSGAMLNALKSLVTRLVMTPPSEAGHADVLCLPDSSGACILHGLLIANHDESVELALES